MDKENNVYLSLTGKVIGGSLAISILVLFGILSFDTRDIPLSVSLICVGISIPFLCLRVVILMYEEIMGCIYQDTPYILWVYVIGVICSYVAIVCIFFHFSFLYGLWFIVVSLAAFVIMYIHFTRESLKQIEGEEKDKDNYIKK